MRQSEVVWLFANRYTSRTIRQLSKERNMKKQLCYLICLVTLLVISGCGQKGKLYKESAEAQRTADGWAAESNR